MLEFHRIFNKKTIGLLVVFSLLSLYFVQVGINNYRDLAEQKHSFQDFELKKIDRYINYGQYGTYGFRIMFIPSPLCIYFFNSSTISELTSNVDSGERLNIYNSFKGRALFAEKSGGFKDFSGIMLLLGSLLALYFGYESLIYKDYLRFLTSTEDVKKVFLSLMAARIFIFILFFLLNAGLSLVLLFVNGVRPARVDYYYFLIYLAVLVLMLIFFFVLGTVAGSLKSRFAGFVMLIFSWFIFVFLAPGVVSAIISRKADTIISNYRLELKKLRTLMAFEKRALEQVGFTNEDNIESVRALMESYWEKEVREFREFEKKLEMEMRTNIRRFQNLSFLSPTSFYLSASNEISSKGYESFIRFFNYIQILKHKFVRFYINKRYYSNYDKVESFVKGDENLFCARSRLPRGFFVGILLTMLYITGLAVLSYFRFKQSLRL
jgi:hypothetical protein